MLKLADENTPAQAHTHTVLLDDLLTLFGMIADNDDQMCVALDCVDPHRVPVCPALMHCEAEKQRQRRGYSSDVCFNALRSYFNVGDAEDDEDGER